MDTNYYIHWTIHSCNFSAIQWNLAYALCNIDVLQDTGRVDFLQQCAYIYFELIHIPIVRSPQVSIRASCTYAEPVWYFFLIVFVFSNLSLMWLFNWDFLIAVLGQYAADAQPLWGGKLSPPFLSNLWSNICSTDTRSMWKLPCNRITRSTEVANENFTLNIFTNDRKFDSSLTLDMFVFICTIWPCWLKFYAKISTLSISWLLLIAWLVCALDADCSRWE